MEENKVMNKNPSFVLFIVYPFLVWIELFGFYQQVGVQEEASFKFVAVSRKSRVFYWAIIQESRSISARDLRFIPVNSQTPSVYPKQQT